LSFEYKQVAFMAVLLGRLSDVHVRDFSDPLLSQSMQIEAWGGAGMGAHLLSVHLGHVWEGRLTSRALPTTLYVVTHCAQPVLAMVTVVSKLDEMLLASCAILSQPFFDLAQEF
jgi:hypothetical protein